MGNCAYRTYKYNDLKWKNKNIHMVFARKSGFLLFFFRSVVGVLFDLIVCGFFYRDNSTITQFIARDVSAFLGVIM